MADYYPPVGFHFKVNFTGNDVSFQEVSGLTAGMEPEQLEVGGENKFTYRLPKRASYSNLVLKRGMLSDSGLIKWFKDAIENFEFTPVDIDVILLNEEHQPLAVWNFKQAYPVKWAISNFNAKGNEVVIETIELAYQYFTRQTDGSSPTKATSTTNSNASPGVTGGVGI